MLDAESDRGVIAEGVSEHEAIGSDTVVCAPTSLRALIGLTGQWVAEVRAVLEVPAALIEVLRTGAVPLGRRRTVGVDAFGAFEKVRGVVAERCFDPRTPHGVADADEFAVALFIGEQPVLTKGC